MTMLDHTQVCTPQTGWRVLLYPPNRPDLAPFDYHIFGPLIRSLWGHQYTNYEAWLIDWHWVQALTVPIQLGLKDGPFLPRNPLSAQKGPVPLPKLQMAPRLKILMSSGSKKGTQIYYPFPSESPGKQIPSRFPSMAPAETDTRLQGICTPLLIYLFISKALRKERILWQQTPIPEPYFS